MGAHALVGCARKSGRSRKVAMRCLTAILCGLWAIALTAADARAEKRVALVIGNSDYQNASQLTNPVRDAKAISELFRTSGFDVVETRLDLGNLDFKRVARDFNTVARDADIAVVYFAGHGIEVNGTNYLLPIDAKLASDFDVEDARHRARAEIAARYFGRVPGQPVRAHDAAQRHNTQREWGASQG
jgi:hypothetical protein